MVDAGDFASAVDATGGGEALLGPTDQQVTLTGHAVIERGDRAFRDVRSGHPGHRKSEIALDLSAHACQQDPVEAGAVQCALHHQAGTEDRAGVAGQHVLARGRALMCFQKRGELGDGVGVVGRLVEDGRVFEVEAGAQIEEGGSAQGHHPAHVVGFARVQDVGGADYVDGLEIVQVLTGAAEQRRAVDGRVGALGRAQHVVGVADVALDQLHTDLGQRGGFVRIANQRAHLVATLDQLLAHVAAGLSGGTGDEDRAGHGSPPCGVLALHIEQI